MKESLIHGSIEPIGLNGIYVAVVGSQSKVDLA
jgi:hypothetical protein